MAIHAVILDKQKIATHENFKTSITSLNTFDKTNKTENKANKSHH